MDLMKLNEKLRRGVVTGDRDRSVDFMSPLGRIRYAAVDKPECPRGEQFRDSKPKWSVTLCFNAGNPTAPGFVDLQAVYVEMIAKTAERFKLRNVIGLEDRSKIVRIQSGQNIVLLDNTATPKYTDNDGKFKLGFGKGIFLTAFSMHPNEKYPDTKPNLVDGKNKVLTPADIVPGHWGRVGGQLYLSKLGTLCFGFSTLQVLAKDEPFPRGGGAMQMEEEEDADELSDEGIDDILD